MKKRHILNSKAIVVVCMAADRTQISLFFYKTDRYFQVVCYIVLQEAERGGEKNVGRTFFAHKNNHSILYLDCDGAEYHAHTHMSFSLVAISAQNME